MKRKLLAVLVLSLPCAALAQEPGTTFWINVQRGGLADISTLGLGVHASWPLLREQAFSVHARAGADLLMLSYLPTFDVQADLLLSTKVNGWNIYGGPQLSGVFPLGVYVGGLAGISAPVSENWAVHVEGGARYPLTASGSFSGQLGWGVRVGLNTRF